MGGSESKVPDPVPVPEPLLGTAWRVIDWTVKDRLLDYVRQYQPKGASHLRILVYGPVGAGKSSFINTVGALIVGRNVNVAATNNFMSRGESFTVQFRTHQFKSQEPERSVPIVFNDLMGLEVSGGHKLNCGVLPADIKLVLEGHVREGYYFNPTHSLSKDDRNYNPNPTVDDKVHVLVCMLNVNATDINASILNAMKEIREAARDLHIPQVAVATHIDLVCEETNEKIQNVYKSKIIQKKMELFSAKVGFPVKDIYAVRSNYEGVNRYAADCLVLIALKDMLDFGDDCIANNQ